jgi:hypothetical protein
MTCRAHELVLDPYGICNPDHKVFILSAAYSEYELLSRLWPPSPELRVALLEAKITSKGPGRNSFEEVVFVFMWNPKSCTKGLSTSI